MMSGAYARATKYIADPWLMGICITLSAIGIVMLASTSLAYAQRENLWPFYYVARQSVYVVLGLLVGYFVLRVKMELWERLANPLLVVSVVLLIVVLIPGVGNEAKGSYRWIDFGLFSVQVSELVKLFVIVYFAAYLTKKWQEVNLSIGKLMKSLLPLLVIAVLLLLEPDLGATAVIAATIVGMFFIAGVHLKYFLMFIVGGMAALMALIYTSNYRHGRLMSFMNPCSPDHYHGDGYQLCQALIAFGRGEWSGVGLGSGMQKESYLPEAHTDFLLAILGEELGAIGTLLVIALFALLFYRAFYIARRAELQQQVFSSLVAFGIAFWLGLQAIVNIGVNMGLLPTKGITLPLVSYGGSSIVVTYIAIAILLRIAYESEALQPVANTKREVAWNSRVS